MRYLAYLLVLIHLSLLLWSVGGFMEMIFDKVAWKPFTNPEFPTWVLIVHWGSVLFASVCFLYGYFTRLNITPRLMTIGYAMMALVCVIETLGYMTSPMKYVAMMAEYLAYVLILILLFRFKYFVDYFKSST